MWRWHHYRHRPPTQIQIHGHVTLLNFRYKETKYILCPLERTQAKYCWSPYQASLYKISHQSTTYICTKKSKNKKYKCSKKTTATILQGCVQTYYSGRETKADNWPQRKICCTETIPLKLFQTDFAKVLRNKSRAVDIINIINLLKMVYIK